MTVAQKVARQTVSSEPQEVQPSDIRIPDIKPATTAKNPYAVSSNAEVPLPTVSAMPTGAGGGYKVHTPADTDRILNMYKAAIPAATTPKNDSNSMLEMYRSAAQKNAAAPSQTYSADPDTDRIMRLYAQNANAAQPTQSAADGFGITAPNYEGLQSSYDNLKNLWQEGQNTYGAGAFGSDFDPYAQDWDDYQRQMYNIDRNAYNALMQNYKSMQSQYDAQEKTASERKRQEYITYELLKKYLPTQLKAQGLGGLGVSQSTIAQMESDYRNRVAGINADSADYTQQILQKYLDAYDDMYLYGEDSVVNQKDAVMAEKTAKDKESLFKQYEQIYGDLISKESVSVDDIAYLLNFVEENKGKFDKNDEKYVETQLETQLGPDKYPLYLRYAKAKKAYDENPTAENKNKMLEEWVYLMYL